MADDKQIGGPGLSGNGFLWLLLVAAGTAFIHQQAPLQDTRPVMTEPALHEYNREQDIDARLWEDPFAAVGKALAQSGKQDPEVARKRHELHASGPAIAADATLIIGVMVPGAPYTEEAESRRRSRYAVLAGLDVEGYVPSDEQHIGYFTGYFADQPGDPRQEKIIPFEKFHNADPHSSALVLWLDEDALGTKPLSALHKVLCWLKPLKPKKIPRVKIIGPGDGETVKSMLDETSRGNRPDFCEFTPEFYSYGATVSDADLLEDKRINGEQESLTDYFRNLTKPLTFYRTITSDYLLLTALAAELRQRRNVHCADQVAVVSERDTLYGQKLPIAFTTAFVLHAVRDAALDAARDGALDSARDAECTDMPRREFRIYYSYLRGLDGQLPGTGSASSVKLTERESQNQDQDNAKKHESSNGTDARPRERADGQGQFDYLRRLAGRLKAQDSEHRRQGRRGIEAIGVFGSDVYDKLLILRALRPEFPDALFFTTDLDARLLDPSEFQWTRNLIVASSFGLQLRDSIQADVPPFRDSYETAAFLSTRLALTEDDPNAPISEKLGKWLAHPQLFEIGRTQAFSLITDPAGDPNTPRECNLTDCDSIQPVERAFQELTGTSLWSAAALLTIVLLASAMSIRKVRAVVAGSIAGRPVPRRLAGTILLVGGMFLASAALCLNWSPIAAYLTAGGLGEPMLMFEGISLWPTILLRCVSAILGVGLIVYTFARLDQNIGEISERLRMSPLCKKISQSHKWKLMEAFSFQLKPQVSASPDEYEIEKFWTKYVIQGRRLSRFFRVAFCVVIMFGVGFILGGIFGFPSVPSRGDLSRGIYGIATLAEVLTMWFLVFLVADASLFSCRFVRELRKVRFVWPESTTSLFRQRLGMDARYLDDWIDVKFVAMRTKCIMGLIYWPFVLLALLVFSRSSLFASFSTSPVIVIMQGISLAILVGCVLWLRWEAEKTRNAARKNMTEELILARGTESPKDGQRAAQIELLLNRVETMQGGAFAPISHQPVVKALLLPLGSYSGVTLLQYLSWPGL